MTRRRLNDVGRARPKTRRENRSPRGSSKALRSDLATQSKALTRFRSEAQLLARFNHTHIATLCTKLVNDDGIWIPTALALAASRQTT